MFCVSVVAASRADWVSAEACCTVVCKPGTVGFAEEIAFKSLKIDVRAAAAAARIFATGAAVAPLSRLRSVTRRLRAAPLDGLKKTAMPSARDERAADSPARTRNRTSDFRRPYHLPASSFNCDATVPFCEEDGSALSAHRTTLTSARSAGAN